MLKTLSSFQVSIPNKFDPAKDQEELIEILYPDLLAATSGGARAATAQLLEAGIGTDWELINQWAKNWARNYTYTLVKKINETSRRFISTNIDEWIKSGEPLPELRKRLEPMFGRVRAEMIAVTEVTRAYAQGNLKAWKSSGHVTHKRWMTAQDELVCPICAPLGRAAPVPLDANGFDAGGNFIEAPPAHVRCRCWLKPILPGDPSLTAPAAAPVVTPTPAPAPPAPAPAPTPAPSAPGAAIEDVSAALDLESLKGSVKRQVKDATDLIDSVHKDGALPKNFKIKQTKRKSFKALGELEMQPNVVEIGGRRYRSWDPSQIMINGTGDHIELTALHELGHFIDAKGITKGANKLGNVVSDFATETDFMDDFLRVAKDSKALKHLDDVVKNPKNYAQKYVSPLTGKEIEYLPDTSHVNYLRRDVEIWARAYAQYIATKTKNKALLEQIVLMRSDPVYGARQWEAEDFKPIAEVIDKMFEGLGWIEK